MAIPLRQQSPQAELQTIGGWVAANRPGQKALYGLCAMHGLLRSDLPMGSAWLEISFGHQFGRIAAAELVSVREDGTYLVSFHVNTHLLENGIQELKVAMAWPDGARVEWQSARFEVDNAGALARSVAKDLRAFGTPTFLGKHIDAHYYPFHAGAATPWFDATLEGEVPELSLEPAKDNEAARRHMQAWGFCILNATLPQELISSFNTEVDQAIASGTLAYESGSSNRIHGAHRLPFGQKIWLYPPVLKFLRDWFHDEPAACQSLLYINGSEQSAHQDTIHLTPYPAGYMCGVWIALEDVQPDSGELFVYPGSHRTPRVTAGALGLEKVTTDYSSYVAFERRMSELLQQGGYERVVYRPKAGQILVWHENLIHGGSRRIRREVTRRSIVSHYFTRGSVAFYDSRGEAATLEDVF